MMEFGFDKILKTITHEIKLDAFFSLSRNNPDDTLAKKLSEWNFCMGQCVSFIRFSRLGSCVRMSVWSWKQSGWLNIAFVCVFISALVLSLISIGVRASFFSFSEDISFNGVSYPEVGVFNLLLYASALLGSICVILRYVFVADRNAVVSNGAHILNKMAVLPGISSFAGLLLIAAFPANSKQKGGPMQTGGAYVLFSMGLLYAFMQTIITYLHCKCSKTFVLRAILLFILAGAFISSVVLVQLNTSEIATTKVDDNDTISSEAIKVEFRVVDFRFLTLILERSYVLVYAVFFLTFFMEFQKISTYMILRPLILSTPSDYSSSWTVNERV